MNMENVPNRRGFCEKITKCLINLLNERYSVNEASDKCLIQRTRHPALKKLGDLHMSKMLVNYLKIKYATTPGKKARFNLELQELFGLLIEKSQTWNIPLTFWKEYDGGFVLGVSRLQAFSYIIPKILNIDAGNSAALPLSRESAMILCHVNTNPVLHDLRTLLYCEVLCNLFKGKCEVVLSKDEEYCGEFSHDDIIRDLNLKMDLVTPAQVEAYHLYNHIVPAHFADCLRDHEKSYPHLKRLHHHGNRTAFASRIANSYKNSFTHKCKQVMSKKSQGLVHCIHICNQTNLLIGQQSELFHAWYKDEHANEEDLDIVQYDQFFSHAGVKGIPSVSTSEFLYKRLTQIKESFESKLQLTADGV